MRRQLLLTVTALGLVAACTAATVGTPTTEPPETSTSSTTTTTVPPSTADGLREVYLPRGVTTQGQTIPPDMQPLYEFSTIDSDVYPTGALVDTTVYAGTGNPQLYPVAEICALLVADGTDLTASMECITPSASIGALTTKPVPLASGETTYRLKVIFDGSTFLPGPPYYQQSEWTRISW